MDKEFFSSREAADLTGCTLRQLQYWREKEIVVPTIAATGTGRSVYYAYPELVELMLMEYLLRIGLSFETGSVILEELRAENWDYLNPDTTEKLMLYWKPELANLQVEWFDELRAAAFLVQGLPVIPLWLEQFHQQLKSKLSQVINPKHQVKDKLKAAEWLTKPHCYREQYKMPKSKGQRSRTTQVIDYVLFYQGETPLAVVEEKAKSQRADQGLKQAVRYAKALGVQFAYATNGESIVEYDLRTGEKSEEKGSFPKPEQLWSRLQHKGE